MLTQEAPNQGVTTPQQQSQDLRARLVQKIHEKRAVVRNFVQKQRQRNNLFTVMNIVFSALTAAITSGPALGGESFTGMVMSLMKLGTDANVWKPLCFAALIVSLISLIANNIYRAEDTAGKLAKAQASSVLLEGLETQVEFGITSVEDGTKLFQQYISDVAFIEGVG